MIFIIFSFFWGYNEGLWFFIIPDVLLSYAALRGWKLAIATTLSATLGSMAAAITLYFVFSHIPEFLILKIEELWSYFPGYYPKMLSVASSHLSLNGAKGMLIGPTSGIPYRFYVLNAFMQNISLQDLLLWTPAARLQRMALAPLAILLIIFLVKKIRPKSPQKIQHLLGPKVFNKILFILITIYWVLIYQWYWGIFLPNTYT